MPIKPPKITPQQITSAKRLFQEGLEQIPKLYNRMDDIYQQLSSLKAANLNTGHLHQVLTSAYHAAEERLKRYFWN
jgi:hypothetical protein